MQTLGWRTAHFRSVRTVRADGSIRYMTPVQGDGKGFPDVIAVRDTRIIVAELKAATGELESPQKEWLEAWRVTPAEVYVWRPVHWFTGEIEEVLR